MCVGAELLWIATMTNRRQEARWLAARTPRSSSLCSLTAGAQWRQRRRSGRAGKYTGASGRPPSSAQTTRINPGRLSSTTFALGAVQHYKPQSAGVRCVIHLSVARPIYRRKNGFGELFTPRDRQYSPPKCCRSINCLCFATYVTLHGSVSGH